MQKTIGIPILPKFNLIDWDYFTKQSNKIEENNIMDFDDNYQLNNINDFQYDISNLTLYNNNESNLSIFLQPIIVAKELEDLSFINYLFIHKSNLLVKNKLFGQFFTISQFFCQILNSNFFFNTFFSLRNKPFL